MSVPQMLGKMKGVDSVTVVKKSLGLIPEKNEDDGVRKSAG